MTGQIKDTLAHLTAREIIGDIVAVICLFALVPAILFLGVML